MSHNQNLTKGMTKTVITLLLLMVQLSVLYHLSVHVFITVHPKSDLTKIYQQVQSFKRCIVHLYLHCKSIKEVFTPSTKCKGIVERQFDCFCSFE